MAEPIWLDQPAMMQAHDEVIALTGGAAGLRDEGLLLSALSRPLNAYGYEGQGDITVLGATYAVAIAKNHPFIDGNKRAAFVGMVVFLARNGLRLRATQEDATATMYGVAEGKIDIDALAAWIRDNSAAT
ncbi:type II toxin-antitoxin system death-on-curing family toxin [Brevundimonas sp.]|uniref:type II toxin-antitoxin system death-on-curing family toxin n=1 Tax=Brevundimonas sp. TaxID=1871086 RepID=UPI00356A2EBF